MKVSDIIEALSNLPGDAEVMVKAGFDGTAHVHMVESDFRATFCGVSVVDTGESFFHNPGGFARYYARKDERPVVAAKSVTL